MSETKVRYYITPSSIASYFGCGFNSPEEQFLIDSGQEPSDFDEDSRLRMALGNHLEDAVIEYFQEEVFHTPITQRNTETKWGYDGKIRYKIDGMMTMGDKQVIFENKISNAQSYKFTENVGYHMQVQSYMLCEDVEKTVLGGLYQGKPIWKVIDRNEEMIDDIKVMVDFIVSALNGLVDFYDDYPVNLLEKYGVAKIYEPITDLSEGTIAYLHELANLNDQKKDIDKQIKDLKDRHQDDFDISEGVYEDDIVKVTVSKWMTKPQFDLDLFQNANPDFDLTPYMNPPVERSKTVIKTK